MADTPLDIAIAFLGAMFATTLSFCILIMQRRSDRNREAIGIAIELFGLAIAMAKTQSFSQIDADVAKFRALSARIVIQHSNWFDESRVFALSERIVSSAVNRRRNLVADRSRLDAATVAAIHMAEKAAVQQISDAADELLQLARAAASGDWFRTVEDQLGNP